MDCYCASSRRGETFLFNRCNAVVAPMKQLDLHNLMRLHKSKQPRAPWAIPGIRLQYAITAGAWLLLPLILVCLHSHLPYPLLEKRERLSSSLLSSLLLNTLCFHSVCFSNPETGRSLGWKINKQRQHLAHLPRC